MPRQGLLVLLGVAISALCLWLVLRHVALRDVWTSLEEASWIWVLPCVVLTYATLAVRAVRWRYLFVDPDRVSTWESAKSINVGLFFSNILPSRAGEVPRILGLGRATGISKVEIGGTVVVERLLDVLTIAIAALVVWPWLPGASWLQALCIICAVITAGFAVTAVALVFLRQQARRSVEWVLRRMPLITDSRAQSLTSSLVRGMRAVSNPRRLALALLLSAAVWTMTAFSVLVLFPAFDLHTSLLGAWLIVVVTSLALTVPSTSGALGVYEAGVQASLVALGISSSTALSYALVLHAVNFLPISLTGLLAGWGYLTRPAPAGSPPSRSATD